MTKSKNSTRNKREMIVRTFMIISILAVIIISYNFISRLQTIKISNEEYKLFQYVMGKKVNYTGVLEITDKNNITKLETKEGTIYLESAPIYYDEENNNRVILPADMAIIFPWDGGRTNKINSLSTVYMNLGSTYISKGHLDKEVSNAFLYDGNDLYFFIENTVLNVNGTEYKLPPLSYANATYKGYIEIFNYDTEEYFYIEDINDDVIARTDNYTINLSNDTYKIDEDDRILLKRLKDLPNFE